MNIGAIGMTFLPTRHGTAAATADDGVSFANALGDEGSPPAPGSVSVQPSDPTLSDVPDVGSSSGGSAPSGASGSDGPQSRRHVILA